MSYKHLTIEEREQIQELLWEKKSIRCIAQQLDRSPSSISREIKKNNPAIKKRYTPRLAHERAIKKRSSRGRNKHLKNEKVREYVHTKLQLNWSPEQISGCVKKDTGETISHEAIYQYIYYQFYRGGNGYLKREGVDLRVYLRRKKSRRTKKGARSCKRVCTDPGVLIDERPSVVQQRVRIGDWEGDTVESCNHKPGINTLVDRTSGMTFITKVRSKSGQSTQDAVSRRMSSLPEHVKHTLTLDNGPENRDWRGMTRASGMDCYYCHPYHSWERGTNENTNGLIREYFPKGTDFTTISESEIQKVEHLLNTRPRKRLGYKTPLEVFSVALGS